jgi:hypothetical protein
MRSLNDYASTRIEEPGRYFATVIECKNDYTRSGKECVFVRFETPENQTIVCSYVDSSYWKLYRLAVAAGLTEEERDRFFDEPELLIGKQVIIDVIRNNAGYLNVNEAYPIKKEERNQYSDVPF